MVLPTIHYLAQTRLPTRVSLALGSGDEVDEFLDAAEQFRLQVGVAGDRAQDAAPRGGDVLRRLVAPADPREHALFPGQPPWDVGPGRQAEPGRLDRRPDVDERVADDEDVGVTGDGGSDPALLGAGDEVVDEDAESPSVLRLEVADDGRQVVDAFQVLDDDADVPQVVAPDLLHQFRVVLALDVDPAGLGDLGPLLRRGERGGRGPQT